MRVPEGVLGRARTLFDRALRLPPDDRGDFLDRECGHDPELRRAIQTLLEVSRIPDALQTGGAIGFLDPEDGADETGVGASIGSYLLVRVLGEGGMGTVYLAEQRAPIRREVALKLIKLGMDTRSVVARFEAERQTLAMLDHPSIAQVFEAGSTERGRPYFVMEYIDGLPLDAHCDERCLALRERLELFVSVCRAFHHAHSRGVLHRDIKPSNILVDAAGDKAIPKIIDFGIAKATEAASGDTTGLTLQGQLIGTPMYMSPERVLGTSVPGVAWDVYSLGVVFYELLTGLLPLELPDPHDAPLSEMVSRFADVEPTEPSVRLNGVADARRGELVRVRSRSNPTEYVRRLKGELDAIAMKAIDFDPLRRYDSALDLATDIERYLTGRTVSARAPSTAYRFRKLVLRHRTIFASLTAIVVLSLTSAVVMAVLWQGQVEERQRAEKARTYLQTVIGSTTNRSVLDSAALSIAEEFGESPRAEADLRMLLGKGYRGLDLFDEAEKQMTWAISSYRSDPGPEHLVTGNAMAELASVVAAKEQYAQAVPLYEEALQVRRRELGPEHESTLTTLISLANVSLEAGEGENARGYFDQAISLAPELAPDGQYLVGLALANLAGVQAARGRWAMADSLYEVSIDLLDGVLSEARVQASHGMMYYFVFWADALEQLGEIERAESACRRALALYDATGTSGTDSYALVLNRMAGLVHQLGRTEEAEMLYLEAKAIYEKSGVEREQNMSVTLVGLGQVRIAQGRFQEGAELLREAEDIAFTKSDVVFGNWARYHYAYCLLEMGQVNEASPLLKESANYLISRDILDEEARHEVQRRLALLTERTQEMPVSEILAQ